MELTIDKDIANDKEKILNRNKLYINLVVLIITIIICIYIITFKKSTDLLYSNISNNQVNKPNIIFILADDMGWNSFGSSNFDTDFTTPNLNKLSSNGIILKNYYAQEVCTPARASLLTGRYPLSIGMQYFMVQSAIPWGLPLQETTLAECLTNNGYTTHMLGKWHLGHHSPLHLPTARGFQTFTGMLNGESFYWSKRNPDHTQYKDFITSDTNCYYPYSGDDIHEYSTFLYRDMAIKIINDHDTSQPLFLYLSFQAVHDPFIDLNGIHSDGIPSDYIKSSIYKKIMSTVKGEKRQQYAMSQYLMDEAIGEVVEALETKGILDNTYVLFSSDNGGCYGGGGKNGPLRGTKGSLFEGGVKVDSFIYSPLIPKSKHGLVYDGLFHISDWFPTINELTNYNFNPLTGFDLDGVSHVSSIFYNQPFPRQTLLYNYYDQVDLYSFNIWKNGSFAIRNENYKLMHTFDSSTYGAWYNTDEILDDDLTDEARCAPQLQLNDGTFTYYLFDLINDPYEKINLYYSTDAIIQSAKEKLYDLLPSILSKATRINFNFFGNREAFVVWADHDDFIVPYIKEDDLKGGLPPTKKSYPKDCY